MFFRHKCVHLRAGDEAVGDHFLSGIEDEEKDGIQFVKQHRAGHDGKQHRQKGNLFHVGEKQVELEELGAAVVRFRACSAILSGGRGVAEDELVEGQNEYAQQEGDGHRGDEGNVKIKLPWEGSLVRAQIPQKTDQKDHNLNGDDEPEIVDEKAFQFHSIEESGQSGMFFFVIGTHLNSLNNLGEAPWLMGAPIQ